MLKGWKLIDLTHTLTEEIPTWHGEPALGIKSEEKIETYTSSGTHMDAPFMLQSFGLPPGNSIDKIPLENLVVPACVIDLSSKAKEGYQIITSDIEEFEKAHGPIAANSLVILYTGWSRFWPDAKAYRNVDQNGTPRFPTLSIKAAELLLSRGIVGIGVDAFSPDPFDSDFPVHRLFFQAGKYFIENLANCDLLPAKGSYVAALPIKWRGQESLARVIAFLPVS